MTNILMLSSSREGDTGYLSHAREMINEALSGVTDVLFIPYAGVTVTADDYTQMVQNALPHLNVTGVHTSNDPVIAVKNAKAILVGGGNTYVLLDSLYRKQLLEPIKEIVAKGIPYIGWSAGSNICGASIKTTNDMPIVEPPSFNALSFVPFQLNPHYTDYQAPGHNGETREQRLMEFSTLSPSVPVVGIREGGALKLENDRLCLIGPHSGVLIKQVTTTTIEAGSDLSQLMTIKD